MHPKYFVYGLARRLSVCRARLLMSLFDMAANLELYASCYLRFNVFGGASI